MDLALLDSRSVIALVSTGLGAFLMFLIQMIVNKRGLFTYVVRHNKRGGPRNLDSGFSESSIVFQAAVPKPVVPKYTTSGVRRPRAR